MCTTIKLVDWTAATGKVQGSLAIFLMFAFTQAPFLFAWIMSANYDNLDKDSVKRKIGSMYLGVHLKGDDTLGLSVAIVFLLRRSIFVAITFALIDHPALQMQAFIFLSVLYMGYLKSVRIYDDQFMLDLEFFNEGLLLLCCYHFLMFTNILNDPYTSELLGISMILTIGLLLAVAAFVMLSVTFKLLWVKCKRKQARRNS